MAHRVCLLPVPDFQLLDMAGPLSVFQIAAGLVPGAYEVTVASAEGGWVRCSAGVPVQTRSWRGLRADTVLVPGGQGAREPQATPAMLAYLRAAHARGRRVASVCTGAFVLAQAGLLEGRRATTHWRHAAELQQRYPAVTVEADRIYVEDGAVWTSAGIAAGIDLALAMVEEDHGRELALRVAREMVMFFKRPGGQSQFSAHLAAQTAERSSIRAIQDYVLAHLKDDLSIPALAARAGMSERNFARVFKQEAGSTPAEFVELARIDAARRLAEESDLPLKRLADEVGYANVDGFRRAFLRRLGVTPSDYRARFRVED